MLSSMNRFSRTRNARLPEISNNILKFLLTHESSVLATVTLLLSQLQLLTLRGRSLGSHIEHNIAAGGACRAPPGAYSNQDIRCT